MTAPPFLSALATLGWFLALPVTTLAAIRVHTWRRHHHPRDEERP